MKFLKNTFQRLDPHFETGGKLVRLAAIYEATKTIFFFPSPQVQTAPHIRDNLDLKRFMSFVLISLFPVTLFGIYNAGLQARWAAGTPAGFLDTLATGAVHVIPIILVSYIVGFFWEILFASLRGHEISEGFLVTGLLFPLTLPPTIPLWQVAAGISFGIVMGKEIFGGTGRNLLNPALAARAFVFFSYPATMSGNAVWTIKERAVDAVSAATPLALSSSTEAIGDVVVEAGFTLKTLILGVYPGSIGGTSALLCFVGGAFLVVTRIANFRIILGGIAGLVATSILFQLLPGPEGTWFSAGPLLHLFSGGFALGICFMATEPVSAPGTDSGRWIYGVFIGSLTVILRAVNPAFVEGVMLAILFMNVFAPLIDHVTVGLAVKKRIPNV